MSDPRPGSIPGESDSGYGPPPPPPLPPHWQEQSTRPPMPALVNYLSIGLFVLVGLQVLSAVLMLANMQPAIDRAVEQAGSNPRVNPEQLAEFARMGIIGSAVISLALAAVFVWLTIMVRKGRNWARITSTVFLGLGILFGLSSLFGGSVVSIVMLLIEIAVLVMLWMRPSNEYFRPAGRAT